MMKIFQGRAMALAVALTLLTVFGGTVLSSAASASGIKAPSCSTVSVSMVKATLGGSPTGPTKDKYGECNYGNAVISYSKSTLALFKSDVAANKGAAIRGIGTSAFSFKGTAGVTVLVVLVGTVQFTIVCPKASLTQKEALARKMVPLV
jgi:hypothetical protein